MLKDRNTPSQVRRVTAGRPAIAIALASAFLAWLTLTGPAHAVLGQSSGSVEADRAHFAAKIASAPGSTYTVHTLALANNSVVREFARPDGVVFAVTWTGPARPDLRQLFGDYFDRFQADNAPVAGRRTRRPLSSNHADFVVRSGGHAGASWGQAFLPQIAPAGFSAGDLR